jgi:hypothetical protein
VVGKLRAELYLDWRNRLPEPPTQLAIEPVNVQDVIEGRTFFEVAVLF